MDTHTRNTNPHSTAECMSQVKLYLTRGAFCKIRRNRLKVCSQSGWTKLLLRSSNKAAISSTENILFHIEKEELRCTVENILFAVHLHSNMCLVCCVVPVACLVYNQTKTWCISKCSKELLLHDVWSKTLQAWTSSLFEMKILIHFKS